MWKFLKFLFVLALLVLPATAPAQIDYATNNGTVTITGYTGAGGALTIPDTINGLPVTSIGDKAFLNNAGLTSVTIPDSVTSIGESAFYNCTSLTSVSISGSVTNIGDGAFLYCTSLLAISVDSSNPVYSSVAGVLLNNSQTTLIQFPGGEAGDYVIPDSVTNIASHAFIDCTSVTSVTIPSGISSIGEDQFLYCTSLSSVTMLDGVSSIGFCAFAGCFSLTNISIPGSVASIGGAAFYHCTSLTNVSIPDSVTNIDASVFYWCTNLFTIEVSPLNPVYSSSGGVLFDKSRTTLVKLPAGNAGSYTIPDSVTNIGNDAFFACDKLTSITIPNSVNNFGNDAFSYCKNLLGVFFQGNAPNNSPLIFQGDANATIYYLQGTAGWAPTFQWLPTVQWDPQVLAQLMYTTNGGVLTITAFTGSGGAVVIPSTINGIPVAAIGTNAFEGCTNLTGIKLPNTITMIGDLAFAGCSALTGIALPCDANGSGVFSNCLALTNVVLSDSAASIGDWEFSDCSALSTITIPGGVTNVGVFAFNDCYNLRGVYFLGDAPSADATVFTGDGIVTNYYLPITSGWGTTFAGRPTVPVLFMTANNSGAITITRYIGLDSTVLVPDLINSLPVTSIASKAFSGYTNLTTITLGSNVVSTAGGLAFAGCSSLQAIFVDAMNPVYSSVAGVLFDKNQTKLIFCPNGLTGNYQIPDGISTIGNNAFASCGGLTSVTFPGSVTSIGGAAFNGCNRLRSYYFLGDAPNACFVAFGATPNATIYYMPGTTGWHQQATISGAGIAPQTNLFGFSITGASNLVIVVEACTNLAKPFWSVLSTNTLSGTPFYFSDPSWLSYPTRFYQVQDFLDFIGVSEVLWNARVQVGNAGSGLQSNQFGLTITGNSNLVFTVEACTNLVNPVWTVLATNTLTGGLYYFGDPQWTNYPTRFYRINPP